ncbi:MAG: response regulator [Thermodesulfovibrionales bacterium]
MKLLIVDDEPLIRELIIQIVDDLSMDIDVSEAENGLEALDKIRAEKPDLVILDIMMPKMSGFDLCRILQSEPPQWDMDVVILSAKGQESDKQTAKALGIKQYITKPFKIEEMIQLIKGYAERKSDSNT